MIFKRIAGGTAAAESGTLSIDDVDAFAERLPASGGFLQLCSLRCIHCEEQVFTALEHALTAIAEHTSFARSAELEFLLRLSAERQLDKALEKVGLKKGKQTVLAIAHAKTKPELQKRFAFLREQGFNAEPGLLEESSKKNRPHICKLYGIEENQLQALQPLPDPLCSAIIERIALTALQEKAGKGQATVQKNKVRTEAGK